MIDTRFKKCPICSTKYNSPEAIVCRNCGNPAINYCTNEKCNRACENDAHFCEICGSVTILGKIEPH